MYGWKCDHSCLLVLKKIFGCFLNFFFHENFYYLEQVNEVVYLGSMFSRDGRYEMYVERRIAAGNRVNGALAALMRR